MTGRLRIFACYVFFQVMARYGRVKTAHRRACLAVALLAAVCLFDGMNEVDATLGRVSLSPWPMAFFFASGAIVDACGVAFLLWVVAVRRAAASLDAEPGVVAARRAIWGFIIPIASLWWPYVGLRDFDRAIDPERVPDAPPRPNPAAHALGYRDGASAPVAHRVRFPRPPLEVWWALYVARFSVACFVGVATGLWGLKYAVDCAAAIAAALVVLRIDARLGERARRIAALSSAPSGYGVAATVSSAESTSLG